MITITGKIEDTTGAAVHAQIDFKALSTPQVLATGIVLTNSDPSVKSNPSDGTFTVQLAAGNYAVTITANGFSSQFNIAVPTGTATMTLDEVVTSNLVYTYAAPTTVWNGTRSGQITFQPIANPAAPTAAASIYIGGHQTSASSFAYQIAWMDQFGNLTFHSSDVNNVAPTGSNNATTLTLPTAPSGVAATWIYRSNNDSTTNRYFLAQVAANVTTYTDWQSATDFAGTMNPANKAPLYNATAGQLLTTGGTIVGVFTDEGLYIPNTNVRLVPGFGAQLYNYDTNLWHTLLCSGSPARLSLDAGQL